MVILNSFDYFVWAFWKLFVWLSFYWTWSSSLLRINLFKSATFILTFIKELVWMMLWFYEKQDLQLFIINLPWSPLYMIIYHREYQIHDKAFLKKITKKYQWYGVRHPISIIIFQWQLLLYIWWASISVPGTCDSGCGFKHVLRAQHSAHSVDGWFVGLCAML